MKRWRRRVLARAWQAGARRVRKKIDDGRAGDIARLTERRRHVTGSDALAGSDMARFAGCL